MIIPIENQLSYSSIPRNKDLKLTIANHCNAPSRQLVVDWKGDCFVCGCEAWLPVTVGNIDSFATLADVWASNTATQLQKDIDSGAFTHCAVDRCGVIDSQLNYKIHTVSINIDQSCNLECPSCRPHKIMITRGSDYEEKLKRTQHLRQLLEEFTEPCHIVMSGNGDPLASSIMRPLIREFKPRATQTIRLFTNGLLLEKQLADAPILSHITQYFISIDAGSAGVYEQVRRGGQWDNLVSNLTWLKNNTKAEVLLMFVLQQSNYTDMHNFCELCEQFGFNGVINRLEDWGTWHNFDEHDVIGNTSHSKHTLAINQLQSVYQRWHQRIQFNSSLIKLCA